MNPAKQTGGRAARAATPTGPTLTAQTNAVLELVARLKDPNESIRGPAWENAGAYGASAVKPLSALMSDPDLETARAAQRALWQVVHYAGRPGAAAERNRVVQQLLPLLPDVSPQVCRELLWMLAGIGGDECVGPISAFLTTELRETAVLALERLPSQRALAALRDALNSAAEEFKPKIAKSLRARGEKVDGYPSTRLVPNRTTVVKTAGSKTTEASV